MAERGLSFGVLGPLRVERPGSEVRVGGARRRGVLLRLLASANEAVPAGLLAEDVWEGDPPSAVAATLQSHVSTLRRVLGSDRLVFVDGGYRLRVETGELDATAFEADVARGRADVARGFLESGLAALEQGLGRWRGEAFADVAGAAWTVAPLARLEEQRHTAVEDALEARLELGLHHDVCIRAEEAVSDQPFRERRWAILMLALYRSGRQADALRTFQRLRSVLADELGIDPTAETRNLEAAILAQDPVLNLPRQSGAVVRATDKGLPSGNVTFMFTDVEGSTRLLRHLGDRYPALLEEHRRIIRAAFQAHDGREVSTDGDGMFVAFSDAAEAVAACVDAQVGLAEHSWPTDGAFRVRMGLHFGIATPTGEGDYVSVAVHQTARIAAAAHGGQVLLSGAMVDLVRAALPAEITVSELGWFRLAGFDEPERIYQLCHLGLRSSFPRLRASPVLAGNLPAPLSTFVGRDAELIELDKLLGAHRLVSIVGAGGIGKTRLAVEVAGRQGDQFKDGVSFVDLSAVEDSGTVASAFARAVGIVSTSDVALDSVLVGWAKDMRALLVVDNCEHVIDAAAGLVASLLEAGPHLRMVATSREPLRVPGERVWNAPPIATPVDPDLLDANTLHEFDAVRLFMDRAGPTLAGDEQIALGQLRSIGRLTERLDGLPLAIELAAARAATVGLDALVALEGRLTLQGVRSRGLKRRQQTLAATIDWSYQLLPAELQAVFRQLSVFAGGFTLEAAARLLNASQPAATDVLAELVERSMLTHTVGSGEPGSQDRYVLLESVRQFAAASLANLEGDEGERRARDLHAQYFSDMATSASGHLAGWHQGQWLTSLEDEHANLRAAILHLLDLSNQSSRALQMIVDLDRFWHNRGHLAECLELAQRAIDQAADSISSDLRCHALRLAGEAAIARDAAQSRALFSASLTLARQNGDDYNAAMALAGLSGAAYMLGDPTDGRTAGQEGVELARRIGDPVLLGKCLVHYALSAAGDLSLAGSLCEEAIDVTRRSGDLTYQYLGHNNLGDCLLAHEEWSKARDHFERAQAIIDEVGNPNPIPLNNLGAIALHQGDLKGAAATYTRALRICRRNGLRYEGAYVLLGMGCLAARAGEATRAVRLIGFADAELDSCGQSWAPLEGRYRDRALEQITHTLGDAFDREYAAGRSAPRDDMLDLALAL